MTVTAAAKLIGVGRPALSNLLNGNAALSADMANRISSAFDYSREGLLDMQAKYDAALAESKDAPVNASAYVPPFLGIKANQIEQWADHNIFARSRFAVFLRTLVHSSGGELTKVDFPGNDDAERSGWDGSVEAQQATPWVPIGRSGWEFGTDQKIKAKADGDFKKSVDALKPPERREMTFVFVTPRRWPGKTEWIEMAKAKKEWRDVRVYDSSDLEQWLERSIPAQVWFANETLMPAHEVRSLDRCWSDWSDVSTPPLPNGLFDSALEAAKRTMQSRLSREPDGPTIISADSTEEAVAFLSQLFGERGGEELAAYRDRVLVFDKPGVLPRLAQGVRTFIPVAYSRQVEKELAHHAKRLHSIVVYPRNATNVESHIVLEPANHDVFTKALEGTGKNRDEVIRLANESGRSLTVLRRRVSLVPAVRLPEWAGDSKTAQSLVPFLFVGAWNSANQTDKLALSLLAGDRPYDELERECQELSRLNDAPTWSIGSYRGVVSKLDLLYAIAGSVTGDDLKRYFSIARMVLGEDDPALDLNEDQRWAAALHEKTREFSATFREGISETLVLLAIHGGNLFKTRLGFDTEAEAARVVRDLLAAPLTTRVLEANERDLPTYAEAAPYEFLSILEQDLKTPNPAVLGLLRPVDSSVFGRSPSRTGLLWALEGLSWSPETLPRAAFILARLAQVEISDNWVNKPTNSLRAIFRDWMPQTAADLETRIGLMKELANRFPDVAWKICVAQFGYNNDVGDYSHKPQWRTDGYGYGEPIPKWGPILEFRREMVETALSWKEHGFDTLSDLVDRLAGLDESFQDRIWTLIDDWAKHKASDNEKAALREKIRRATLTRRAAIRARKKGRRVGLAGRAEAVYAALEPTDPLLKHEWLFRDTWVEESADEIENLEKMDYEKRGLRIQKKRLDAMREVLNAGGLSSLLSLAEQGRASWTVGFIAAKELLSENDLIALLRLALRRALDEEGQSHASKHLISGALRASLGTGAIGKILKSAMTGLPEENVAQLLMLAPFGVGTWRMVDELSDSIKARYWKDVVPDFIQHSDEELAAGVEYLLKAERPRAAFSSMHFQSKNLEATLLFRVLSAAASDNGNDLPGEYLLEEYSINEAFKHINESPLLTLDQKASLEFAYIDALELPSGNGTPNLERYVEKHPELFVQAVAWVFKRRDGGTDPKEFQVSPDRRSVMAARGYKLLKSIHRIPGHDDFGELKEDKLAKWIADARHACADLSRAEVADECIGQILAHAPVGKDGVWPCEQVRQILEETQSENIMGGTHTGVFNLRGIHFRSEGGGQERELADKYRKWGEALRLSHPYVSANLLMKLAKTYEFEGTREDTEAGIRRRLR